jgi:hypothetical protein
MGCDGERKGFDEILLSFCLVPIASASLVVEGAVISLSP